MSILKRFINWLFGKHWGYTKKEVKELEQQPLETDYPEPHTEQSFEQVINSDPRSMTPIEYKIYYGEGYRAFEQYKKSICQ